MFLARLLSRVAACSYGKAISDLRTLLLPDMAVTCRRKTLRILLNVAYLRAAPFHETSREVLLQSRAVLSSYEYLMYA